MLRVGEKKQGREGGRQAVGSRNKTGLQVKFGPGNEIAQAGQVDPGSFIKMAWTQTQAGENQLTA